MVSHYFLAFLCYFAILIIIAFVSHRKQTTNTEFIVGNRSLSFWLTALSAHASDMSGWLFMGLPMVIHMNGLSGSWIAVGLLIGMFLNWQFVATKLRIMTEESKTCTLSSFFEKRFDDHSGMIRIVTALMLIYYLTHYLAAGLTAMGILIESVFDINYYWGLTFATIVVVSYTFGGGFVTIAWTDLFQALFLLFVIILMPVIGLFHINNPLNAIQQYAASHPGYLSVLGEKDPQSFLSALFLVTSWGLGYFGMPHIITKFMGIRNVSEMHKSKYLGMTWQFLALSAAIAVGVVGGILFQDKLDNPQLIFIQMVKTLTSPFIAGFILCGVLAANLSTMDSQLLVCASAVGEDLYKRFAEKRSKPLQLVRASRAGVIAIAFVALLIAYMRNATVYDSVEYAWSGLGSSFGPLVLMSLYGKKINRYGAMAGIIIGGGLAGIWPRLNPLLFDIQIPSMIVGFSLGFLGIFIVSRMTGKK